MNPHPRRRVPSAIYINGDAIQMNPARLQTVPAAIPIMAPRIPTNPAAPYLNPPTISPPGMGIYPKEPDPRNERGR